jgi:hypothetical protein
MEAEGGVARVDGRYQEPTEAGTPKSRMSPMRRQRFNCRDRDFTGLKRPYLGGVGRELQRVAEDTSSCRTSDARRFGP